MKFNSRFSLILLVVLSLLGVGYIGRYVLGMKPGQKLVHFEVMIPSSGGLLQDSPVLINGSLAGRVRGIDVTTAGLRVRGDYDAKYLVSKASTVVIANLSLAGEQFVNFVQPDGNPGPYFEDGASISDPKQIHVSVTVGEALEKVTSLSDQLDPSVLDDVASTFDEVLKDTAAETEAFREFLRQDTRVVDGHADQIAGIFVNLQLVLDLVHTLGPRLPDIAVQLTGIVPPIKEVLTAFKIYGEQSTPDQWHAVERVAMTVDRFLGEVIQDSHPVLMALKPISAYFRTTYFDPASTMNTLLRMLPQDGVPRVILNMAG